jgi:sulfate permease, SulP family
MNEAGAEAAAAAVPTEAEIDSLLLLLLSSSPIVPPRTSSLMGYIAPVVATSNTTTSSSSSPYHHHHHQQQQQQQQHHYPLQHDAVIGMDDDRSGSCDLLEWRSSNIFQEQTEHEFASMDVDDNNDNHHHDDESHRGAAAAAQAQHHMEQEAATSSTVVLDFGRERRSRTSFVDPESSSINFHHHHHHHQKRKEDEHQHQHGDNNGNGDSDILDAMNLSSSTVATTAVEDYGSIVVAAAAALAVEQDHHQHQHDDGLLGKQQQHHYCLPNIQEDSPLLFATTSSASEKEKQQQQQQQQQQRYSDNVMMENVQDYVEQIPAILMSILLSLMVAVPFGVSYFPIGWTNTPLPDNTSGSDESTGDGDTNGDNNNNVYGPFPLPGKEALGIRMALFATLVGQVVLTLASNFDNPVAFQLLENVPFYHALAKIVTTEMGFGMDALATLFFLFGLSSILVGAVFYTLGRLRLGRVTYYFPGHVLVGCIGGIGVFIIFTSIEVSTNQHFTLTREGILTFIDKIHLYGLVIILEIALRLLSYTLTDRKTGQQKCRFLTPIFFCAIVPCFYIGLLVLGVSRSQAKDMGYLFPDPADAATVGATSGLSFHNRVFDGHVLDMFLIVASIPKFINWTAIRKSLGTVTALCSFSLIHVPINIPAFAVSSDVDVDMDVELMAHGYSNALSGMFCGLQNVMTYSCSVLFMKSGGHGKASCLTIAFLTGVLFVYGPAIAVFFPRCMAGTLLLHLGLDLFLEGVYDSYRNFDRLEYAGIWFITITMTTFGMTAGLVAGVLSALSTHAIQSITHLNPIFRIRSASTLRSSGSWCRTEKAVALLDDPQTGRARIMVVQLQGHLFFGNVSEMTDHVKRTLNSKKAANDEEQPLIVILDFSLVVGMDSAAAHSIAKLKNIMHRLFDVEITIFVTGSHRNGFPCDYALSEALMMARKAIQNDDAVASHIVGRLWRPHPCHSDGNGDSACWSMTVLTPESILCLSTTDRARPEKAIKLHDFPRNLVCTCLDEALIFAEDVLIAREDPFLLTSKTPTRPKFHRQSLLNPTFDREQDDIAEFNMTETEERMLALRLAKAVIPDGQKPETEQELLKLLAVMRREVYRKDDVIWTQESESDCAKLLISGRLICGVEGTEIGEVVISGNFVGELGLVDGTRRLNTVKCESKVAILYSLDRTAWEELNRTSPHAARLMDRLVIRNLAHRIQHVSNRIFETNCMPI